MLTEKYFLKDVSLYFPDLESEDIHALYKVFISIEKEDLKIILDPEIRLASKGKRYSIAYLQAAPSVYGCTKKDVFDRWLLLVQKISSLSISCIEGFLEASSLIIDKGGIHVLEKWTDLGISFYEKQRWMSIAYFKYTGKVVISTNFDNFLQLIKTGRDFGEVDVNIAEAYLKELAVFHKMLSPEDFLLWCNILESMLKMHWKSVVDIIEKTSMVLEQLSSNRRKNILQELRGFLIHGGKTTISLLNNVVTITERLDDINMKELINIASCIAKVDQEASVSFLEMSAEYVSYIEIDIIREWINKGLESLVDKHALNEYIKGSFKILVSDPRKVFAGDRDYLLDIGVKIAQNNPDVVKSYFDNVKDVFSLLSKEDLRKWVDIGTEISRHSSTYGSGYFRSSVSVIKKIPPSYHRELFMAGFKLLEKDWGLAGVFFEKLPNIIEKISPKDIGRWSDTGIVIYEHDKRLSVDYFSSSSHIIKELDIEGLEEWALRGIDIFKNNPSLGRPYFSLRSKTSKDFIQELSGSVALQKVAPVLRYYALGLSGVNFTILSKTDLGLKENIDEIYPIVAGRKIYLPPRIKKFGGHDDNFRIYKLSVMHEVGHLKFGSMNVSLTKNGTIIERIKNIFYINKATKENEILNKTDILSNDVLYIPDLIASFDNQALASSIFGVLEDARVEYMVMHSYKGVRSDMQNIRHQMLTPRVRPEGSIAQFMEALLWISAGHEPDFELDYTCTMLMNKIRDRLYDQILDENSSTFDCMELTLEIYKLLDERFGPLEVKVFEPIKNIEYRGIDIGAFYCKTEEGKKPDNITNRFIPQNPEKTVHETKGPDTINTEEAVKERRSYVMEKRWNIRASYKYDEWDTSISDYKADWCTVNEIEPVGISNDYYEDASKRYRNEIVLIRSLFSMMKPEAFHRMRGQNDGTEIDIDAFIDALIDKRCGINPMNRFYIRWDKHQRDVATLFLIDVSASTRKVLGRDGKSILEVEKDALILMSQALESIGDKYSIYAFSGNTREDVEFFVIKDFKEGLDKEVARRISLLEPVANTRLGPAIRHSITKLEQIDAKTKIIMLLSDGEPYDAYTRDGAYQGHLAEEDTKAAIGEAMSLGMHLFCITVDNNPGEYLENIFSDVGYTIIDDARDLPESLPLLYKRITT